MGFVGRKRETVGLTKLYDSGKFEFVVIYGRRRVGKTALMTDFLRDKKAIMFTGVETNAQQNLENLSKCIMEYERTISTDMVFLSFQSALEHVFEMSLNDRIALAIDEYPYVARAESSFASTLQMLIDKYKDRSKLFLILSGSSMSYMEDKVLAYKAPLYGRRTAQYKIQPFDFFEACECFPRLSAEDKVYAYAIAGGTPQYALKINDRLSVKQNICDLYLDPSSSLFEEPTNLLKQEIRETTVYNAIITAIATGSSRLSEIASKLGESSAVCATYIKNLSDLDLIKKETPYGEKGSKRTLYSLSDNMFRFWYRFVPQNISTISRGAQDIAYAKIEPQLSGFTGPVFEEVCKQYLWKLLLDGKCTVNFTDLGRWWGANPKTKKQEEIDVMGASDDGSALFAECKWTNEHVSASVLDILTERAKLFGYDKKHYYLFAKSGFTDECKQKADKLGNVTLVTLDDILNDS